MTVQITPSAEGIPVLRCGGQINIRCLLSTMNLLARAILQSVRTYHDLGKWRSVRWGGELIAARAKQITRVSFASCLCGYLASRFVNARVASNAFHRLHSELVALWSIGLIAGDTIVDSGELTEAEIAQFLDDLVGSLLGRDTTPNHPGWRPSASLYRAALDLASAFRCAANQLGEYHSTCGNSSDFGQSVRGFDRRLRDLLHGYLESSKQRRPEAGVDWGWYYNLVSRNAANSALAPLGLFASLCGEQGRLASLEALWTSLNRLFFDIQVIDDLLDVREDIDSRIATTPLYLLLGQARLASTVIELGPTRWHEKETVLRFLVESNLLLSFSRAWRDCRQQLGIKDDRISELKGTDVGPEVLDTLLVYALSNCAGDSERTLVDLSQMCVQRGEAAVRAWDRNDKEGTVALFTESGAASRVLDTVEDPRNMADVASELNGLDSNLEVLMRALHFWATRRYQRVLKVWRPRGQN